MTCIRCELTRAKIVATTMNAFDYPWLQIMERLNRNNHGNHYYIETEPFEANPRRTWIKRDNQTPPHVPYVILERTI